jgi:integrase
MTYLAKSEISRLLDTLTGDDRRFALLCLSTGARWGEGSTLRGEQVNHGRVTFLKTKNGKSARFRYRKNWRKRSRPATPGHCSKLIMKTSANGSTG